MELIRGQHNLRPRHHGCVATIGNFDGVHLGHQAIFRQLRVQAERLHLPTTVITFEPHPQEFFTPQAPPRLMRLREKLLALAEQRIERVLCLRFNEQLAHMPASLFINQLIVEQLGIRYLVVGDDFRFGARREGDFAMLKAAGIQNNFEVSDTDTYVIEHQRVSSTRIRALLQRGELAQAAQLLGRPYAICGRVAHGDKRGRTLGFPTANVHLHRKATPLSGVYVVKVHGITEKPWPGMANVGNRPTVGGQRAQLEVHLLDFRGDIYGHYVQVDFLAFLRPEKHFASLDALRHHLAQDLHATHQYFAAFHSPS